MDHFTMFSWLVVLVLSCTASVPSLAIDNEFVADPVVICNDHSIGIVFSTRNPFYGHVFVKDLYRNLDCRDDYQQKTGPIEFSRNFSSCGVRRERSLNPTGVHASMIIKITFHPQFVSKLDRTVFVQCFYAAETDTQVSTGVSSSVLDRKSFPNSALMPVCRYEVLDAPEGSVLSLVKVGQTTYHRWTCDTDAIDTFCMTVHSCSIDAGNLGDSTAMINENGCTADSYVIRDLEYSSDLTAIQAVDGFKLPDNPNLFFNCQIRIERKNPGDKCKRPNCSISSHLSRRLGRQVQESDEENRYYHFAVGKACDSAWTTCLDVGSHVSVINQFSNGSSSQTTIDWLEKEICLTQSDYYAAIAGAALVCVLMTAFVFFAAGLNQR